MKKIPDASARRIPIYYQGVLRLHKLGLKKVSSTQLGDYLSIEPTTIRRDFAHIGELGKQGYGYDISRLSKALAAELGDFQEKVIVIGAGNLGKALISYNFSEDSHLKIVKGFDINPEIVGKSINNVPIYHIDDLEKYYDNESLAILSVDFSAAERIIESLSALEVKCILNFTSQRYNSNDNIIIHNVDLSAEMLMLSYLVKNIKE